MTHEPALPPPVLPPDAPVASANRDELIHAVYRIALEPQAYDAFMDHWDNHVGHAIERLSMLRESSDLDDPEIIAHFTTAFGILEELGRRAEVPLRDGKGPRLLIDARGAIVWRNAAAAAAFGIEAPSGLDAVAAQLQPPGVLHRLVAEMAPGFEGRVLRHEGEASTGYLLARTVTDREGGRMLLVEPLLAEWTPEMDRLLREEFDLTPAEAAVAAGLAEGASPGELARRRNVSLLTVRAQIRAILAKTGASGQTDLVRLLMSVARVVERLGSEGDGPAQPAVCIARSGREIPVELSGEPGGLPVLFLHGMLDGCSSTPRIERALCRHGLRLLAPVRPGYGTAAPDDGPVASAPARFAADVEAMLDRLRLERVVLLGHMAGSLHAFALAARLGSRVAGIVNVSGTVPIVSHAQFAGMSRRQRLVAYTARYAPAALPFVLRAGIRQLDFDGERDFMRALYEASPPDLAATGDVDIFRSLRRGYRFTVAQGHRAFATDGYHVVRDWSALALRSDVPVALVHGRHDPVVPVARVAEFAARLGGRARMDVVEDCGQLVLYQVPDRVFGILTALVSTDRPAPIAAAVQSRTGRGRGGAGA